MEFADFYFKDGEREITFRLSFDDIYLARPNNVTPVCNTHELIGCLEWLLGVAKGLDALKVPDASSPT